MTIPTIGTPDLLAASDSGVSSSDNLTNKTTPNFSGTASSGSTVTLYDTDGTSVLGTATASGIGKWTITSSTLSEGAHMIAARAADGVDVSGLSSKLTVTIDTTAPVTRPDAPTMDSGSDSGVSNSDQITNLATLEFTGTGTDANSYVNFYLDGALLGTTLADGGGNYTYSYGGPVIADGVHAFTAKNLDNAGNVGPASTALSITMDTQTTATIATFKLSADTGSSTTDFITNTAAQTISGTTSVNLTANDIVEISLDNGGSWNTATTSAGSNAFSLGGQTLTASDTLKVRVSDKAGNVGAVSTQAYVLDTTAPTTTIATTTLSADTGSSASDWNTSTAAQTISGTTSAVMAAGDIVQVSIDNGASWSTATTTVGLDTWTINKTLAASNTLQVRVTDNAGNGGTAASQAYVLDTLAPNAPPAPTLVAGSDSGVSNSDGNTSNTAPGISGTAEAGATVRLYDTDGTTVLGTATATGGNWSITSTALAQGAHVLTVKATDTAGNVSLASGSTTVTIDTTAPAFASANVNGNTLVMTYTDTFNLDANSTAGNAAFTVMAGGSADVVTATLVNPAVQTVTLTLTSAVTQGQVVTVAYTDPTGADDLNAIQDTAGNDAATLTATAVTNTTAAPPPAPSSGSAPAPITATALAPGGTVQGGPGNDTLTGLGGDETFILGGGSDTVIGGAGIDTAVVSSARANYKLSHTADGGFTLKGSNDGSTSSLTGVERIKFGDVTIALDTTLTTGKIAQLYGITLGRNPEDSGLRYYTDAMAKISTADIAAGFVASPEFAKAYGAMTDSAFITQMYTNAFSRAPDSQGMAFYLDMLSHVHGLEGRANLLAGFVDAPEMQVKLTGLIDAGVTLLNTGG